MILVLGPLGLGGPAPLGSRLLVPLAGVVFAWAYAFGAAQLPALLLGAVAGVMLSGGAMERSGADLPIVLGCVAAGACFRAWLATRERAARADAARGLIIAGLAAAMASVVLRVVLGGWQPAAAAADAGLGALVGLLTLAPALVMGIDRLAAGRRPSRRVGDRPWAAWLGAAVCGLATAAMVALMVLSAQRPSDVARLLPLAGLPTVLCALHCGYAPTAALLALTALLTAAAGVGLGAGGGASTIQVGYIASAMAALVAAAATSDRQRDLAGLDRAMRQRTRELELANRRLVRQASTDALTGLLNRHAFSTAAERRLALGRGGALLFLDLDHFKSINDQLGHAAGDMVLAAVAGTVRQQIREHDLAGRWGGEEFVLLLDGVAPGDAAACAERIRAAVRSGAGLPGGAHRNRVSVSVGVAAILPGESLADALRRADAALYAAKHRGRNRCVVAPAA
jgi:diguanylate cyclase (GGDEF)-like protein